MLINTHVMDIGLTTTQVERYVAGVTNRKLTESSTRHCCSFAVTSSMMVLLGSMVTSWYQSFDIFRISFSCSVSPCKCCGAKQASSLQRLLNICAWYKDDCLWTTTRRRIQPLTRLSARKTFSRMYRWRAKPFALHITWQCCGCPTRFGAERLGFSLAAVEPLWAFHQTSPAPLLRAALLSRGLRLQQVAVHFKWLLAANGCNGRSRPPCRTQSGHPCQFLRVAC